jgi:hypothetical protein
MRQATLGLRPEVSVASWIPAFAAASLIGNPGDQVLEMVAHRPGYFLFPRQRVFFQPLSVG